MEIKFGSRSILAFPNLPAQGRNLHRTLSSLCLFPIVSCSRIFVSAAVLTYIKRTHFDVGTAGGGDFTGLSSECRRESN
jgi:hypothetical protein